MLLILYLGSAKLKPGFGLFSILFQMTALVWLLSKDEKISKLIVSDKYTSRPGIG